MLLLPEKIGGVLARTPHRARSELNDRSLFGP